MTKIQLRRDTASNWSTNNPTPSAGEPCFETDTGKLKIGDGSTAYNDLAYQGGSGDIPVASDTTLGGVKIGSTVKLDGDNKLGINSESTLINDIRNTNTATYNLGLGSYTTEKYSPLIKYNKDNHTVTARMTDRQSVNGFTSYDNPIDVTIMAKSFKVGDVTNQYDVVTKSPINNKYMAHMAMPSDKFIDLELGASGTTYVAPADGYYRLTMKQAAPEQYAYLASYTDSDEPILSTTSKTATGTDSLSTWIPVHKGHKVKAVYNAPDKRVFKFIYAIGSEPAS